MAYDEFLAERIRNILRDRQVVFSEIKMMGGLCFKVQDKMLCGIHLDKKYGDNLLMTRIGTVAYAKVMHKDCCLPMDFTGKPMKGYAFITPDGFAADEDLGFWLQLCLDYNPLAKASRKRNK